MRTIGNPRTILRPPFGGHVLVFNEKLQMSSFLTQMSSLLQLLLMPLRDGQRLGHRGSGDKIINGDNTPFGLR